MTVRLCLAILVSKFIIRCSANGPPFPPCSDPILPPSLVSVENLPEAPFSIIFQIYQCETQNQSAGIATKPCLQLMVTGANVLVFENCSSPNNVSEISSCLLQVIYSRVEKVAQPPLAQGIVVWTNGTGKSLISWDCNIVDKSLTSLLFEGIKTTIAVNQQGVIYSETGFFKSKRLTKSTDNVEIEADLNKLYFLFAIPVVILVGILMTLVTIFIEKKQGRGPLFQRQNSAVANSQNSVVGRPFGETVAKSVLSRSSP